MGPIILLFKTYEDESVVIYKFGINEEQVGRIKLNKSTKIFSELEPFPGESSKESSKNLFDRTARRLSKIFVKEGGCFPDIDHINP